MSKDKKLHVHAADQSSKNSREREIPLIGHGSCSKYCIAAEKTMGPKAFGLPRIFH